MGKTKTFYNIDDNLFKVIDTEEKAYILGFVAADGYISPEGKVRITLNNKDINILKKIRSYICKDLKISKRPKYCALQISRVQIAKDMARHLKIPFGVAKSFIVKFPDIDKKLIKHFIRGYFDGDGHITTNLERRNYFYAGFTSGSKSMLKSIIKHTHNVTLRKHSTKNAYIIKFYSRKGILLADHMYKDSKIHLDRKYKLYVKWKKVFDKPNKFGHHVGVRMFSGSNSTVKLDNI